MIRVKGLKKAFGDHLVLKGIDYEIKKGEKIVVVGPSGSGKSTFLRCLNLLEKPTEGEIWFEDQLITDPKVKLDEIREQMGMVFQQFNLFNNLTILKNITLAPVKLKLMSKEEADEKAFQLLNRIGLRDKPMRIPPSFPAAEAAYRDHPRAGDEPEDDALRRADERTRSGDGRRGAGRYEGACRQRHDDVCRHA